MPELPEVETVRRTIEPQIAGKAIISVTVGNAQVIAYPEAEAFADALQGQRILSVSRRGKFLAVHFESGDHLCLHLRMTGQLLVTPKGYPAEKHTHLIFSLSDNNEIRYIDVRRFGRFWLFGRDEADILTGRSKLGLEPADPSLTADYLKSKLGRSKKPVKEMLHDQSIVAGIGNIYSDEILFASGIYPGMPCNELLLSEVSKEMQSVSYLNEWHPNDKGEDKLCYIMISVKSSSPEYILSGMRRRNALKTIEIAL